MRALVLAAFLLAGCATTQTMPVERSAALARGSHALACQAVETAHNSGTLSGKNFNAARTACIQADDLMDAADTALLLGQTATAVAKLHAASKLIEAANKATQ